MNFRKLYTNTNSLLDERTSSILDFIRGISALLVVLNHFRNLFFGGFDSTSNILTIFLYSIASLGHQAVIVFFVLSGFFIANSVMKSIYNQNWSWKHYIINRFTRLYVVLIPALLIGLTLDKTGMILFDYSFFPHDMEEKTNVSTFFSNLFFFQGIFTETLGSNDPLWSLSYEFWYYILFPIVVIALVSENYLKKLIYFCLFALIIMFIGKNMSIYFLIWLSGALLIFAPRFSVNSRILRILITGLIVSSFMGSILIIRLQLVSIVMGDFFLAISFTLLVWVIMNIKSRINFANTASFVAGFSFTLYLVHFPLIIFLYALCREFGFSKFSNDFPSLMIAVLLLLFIIGISYVISIFTEAKTGKIRRCIYKNYLKLETKFKINSKTISK